MKIKIFVVKNREEKLLLVALIAVIFGDFVVLFKYLNNKFSPRSEMGAVRCSRARAQITKYVFQVSKYILHSLS